MEHFQPLRPYLHIQRGHTREVAIGPAQAGDKSKLDRVAAGKKDDWNRGGRRLSRQYRRKSVDGGNHSHLTMNKISRESRQSIVLTLCPSIFDRDIPVLDVAGFGEASVERGNCVTQRSQRSAANEPNPRNGWLLRPCPEWRHEGPEQSKEFPSSD